MSNREHKREEHEKGNEMEEAFNANLEINEAFNNLDGGDAQAEGESLAHHYLHNNTATVDVKAKQKPESDVEKELKRHD